jgi:hypothetical protein
LTYAIIDVDKEQAWGQILTEEYGVKSWPAFLLDGKVTDVATLVSI